MTAPATIREADIRRAIRAARKEGAQVVLDPRSGRVIIDPTPAPLFAPPTPADDHSPNPWEEGLPDAAP